MGGGGGTSGLARGREVPTAGIGDDDGAGEGGREWMKYWRQLARTCVREYNKFAAS